MSLTFTDIFCGAGGSSIGLTGAGFELKLAANHWQTAIDTHQANFAHAEHVCADINNYDMRRLPRTDVLWASPICTENSPAGGRKRSRRPKGQLDLFEEDGHVPAAGFERTRATFHDVIRATEVHRYKAVIVENVTEAADWELWDWWLSGMVILGYNYQLVSVSSAHVGGEDNPYAPQWRDRLYIVFTRKGIPLPDLRLKPLAWCWSCEAVVESYQWWKQPGRPKIGKYRRQYLYRCSRLECRHSVAEPFILPARSAIDWADLGTRIGDRKRTKAKPEGLAPATMTRIRAARDMFSEPALVRANGRDPEGSTYLRVRPVGGSPAGTVTTTRDEGLAVSPLIVAAGGNTWVQPGSGYVRAWPVDEPLTSRTGTAGDALAVPPFITMLRGPANAPTAITDPLATVTTGRNHALVLPVGGNNHDEPPTLTDEPLRTRMVRDTDALVCPPFITVLRNNATAHGVDEPVSTVTGLSSHGGGHHALTVPPFVIKNYGGYCEPKHNVDPIDGPLSAVTVKDHHALVVPYRGRRSRPSTTAEPLHTLATKESAALVHPDDSDEMAEWLFRMLKPREHLRAQRFPDHYIVTGNGGEQTMQAGNAVSANVAQWIGSAVAAVL